jgi:hypothetical protein
MGLVVHIHVHGTVAQRNSGGGLLVISGGLFGNGEYRLRGTITSGGVVDGGGVKGLDEKKINEK